ncbi:ORF1 [Halorubrum pleomorphic virus 1]|uniref:Uncharacterized protein 1 n=1 Tax=Halorubrum pleomorphic virus 1 TaxID=634168 RepID=ORF1_HAPV1|nr:hypothetical protein HRPV-1_gp1 [Halorubrum pleomorphic virus 1]C1JJY0.1 RecName: Full=Uncharacterized protein 1 [Halorubrum pleomorphic virus 1]ACO54896.1 ORF1 [Halorubrum pleomorphic virus 1]
MSHNDTPANNTNGIADVYADENPCEIAGEDNPPQPYSCFDGEDRAHDKTRIIKWLCYHPKGVPLARTVKALFPDDSEKRISERSYTSTDYNFVSRFLERTGYAVLDSEAGLIEASPTSRAFHLTLESKIPSEHTTNYAKDRAEACAYGMWSLNDVENARLLAKDFTTYLESIHDRRLMLENVDNPDMKLTMPYHTRFNDDRRKAEQWARYNSAWEAADDKYSSGVMVTLTTDPKRYDSIGEMLDGLMDAWQNLHETLNQRYLEGTRLDFIRALEFGGSEKSNHIGLPHLHVCVFGVPYIDHRWLKHYWSSKHAEIVHIHGMNKRGNDSWIMTSGTHAGKSVAGYLGKYLSKTFERIADDPDELREHYQSWSEGGDWANSELWKLALYWATGRQFWASSHDLKDDSRNFDTLQEVPGLGETKLDRLEAHGIQTLSDVRLASVDEIASIDGISESFAEKLKDLVGEPSEFDVFRFEFRGAARYEEMPASWSHARHLGVSACG